MLRVAFIVTFVVATSVFGASEALAQYSCGSHCGISRPPNNLGLAGYWSFNEATSTVATDFSGNGNHATFGAGSAAPTWVSGKRGTALSFDNSDDYTEAPQSTSLDITGTLTIAFWVKRNSLGNFENWVGKGVGASDKIQYFVAGYGDEYYFQLCSDADAACTGAHLRRTTDANMQIGVWHHIAVTYDDAGNSIVMYLDGVARSEEDFIGSAETNSMLSTTHPLRIGELYSADVPNATLDEVRIYNRVLDGTEVTALYGSGAIRLAASSKTLTNGTTLGPANGLVGLWTFDGGDMNWTSQTAGTAYDGSGNGNHGTLTNMNRSNGVTIGKLGQALQLNNGTDFVNAGSGATLDTLSAITACAWVYQRTDPPDSYDMIFDKTSDGSDGWELFISAPIGGFGFQNNLGDVKEATINTNQHNAWHHLCGVWTGADGHTSITLYEDGVDTGSDSAANGTASGTDGSNSLGIGGGVSVGLYQNGYIDEARVYNRALSASEIKQLYLLGKTLIDP